MTKIATPSKSVSPAKTPIGTKPAVKKPGLTQAEAYREFKKDADAADPVLKAAKLKYRKMLLAIRYSDRKITWRADRMHTSTSYVLYEQAMRYTDARDWLQLPKEHRLKALEALAFAKVDVPGGRMYRITEHSSGGPDLTEWVFLNVEHSIGRCTPTPLVMGARVH